MVVFQNKHLIWIFRAEYDLQNNLPFFVTCQNGWWIDYLKLKPSQPRFPGFWQWLVVISHPDWYQQTHPTRPRLRSKRTSHIMSHCVIDGLLERDWIYSAWHVLIQTDSHVRVRGQIQYIVVSLHYSQYRIIDFQFSQAVKILSFISFGWNSSVICIVMYRFCLCIISPEG